MVSQVRWEDEVIIDTDLLMQRGGLKVSSVVANHPIIGAAAKQPPSKLANCCHNNNGKEIHCMKYLQLEDCLCFWHSLITSLLHSFVSSSFAIAMQYVWCEYSQS